MKHRPLLYFVVGTRPEAIKLCPVIRAALASNQFRVRVCATGQHRELSEEVLEWFGVTPDIDLRAMREGQSLSGLLARLLLALDADLQICQPDMVIVQGDTSSAVAGAMAAFNLRRGVGHVEAGLRTYDLALPWPEEFNRRVVALATSVHFAPTDIAAQNLIREGISETRIEVTGNTVIDGLLVSIQRARSAIGELPDDDPLRELAEGRRIVLVTAHRRENRGQGVSDLCAAVSNISQMNDVQVVWPVHPNPEIRAAIEANLGARENVKLLPPLKYASFIRMLDAASVIVTDSGGVQEEAAALGKPLVIVREVTERPEVLGLRTTRLVGTDPVRITHAVAELLGATRDLHPSEVDVVPFGDGRASARIVARLSREFGLSGTSATPLPDETEHGSPY